MAVLKEQKPRNSQVASIGALRVSRLIVLHVLKAMKCRERAVGSWKAAVDRSDKPWVGAEKHVAYNIVKYNIPPQDVVDFDEVCQWFGLGPNNGKSKRTVQKIGEKANIKGIQSDKRTFTVCLGTRAAGFWCRPTFLIKEADAGKEAHRQKKRGKAASKKAAIAKAAKQRLKRKPLIRLEKVRQHRVEDIGGELGDFAFIHINKEGLHEPL